MSKNFTVADNCVLRQLCIKKDWFTSGDIKQYNKLFYANAAGYSISEIAVIIWLCSNDKQSKDEILSELKACDDAYVERYESPNDNYFW